MIRAKIVMAVMTSRNKRHTMHLGVINYAQSVMGSSSEIATACTVQKMSRSDKRRYIAVPTTGGDPVEMTSANRAALSVSIFGRRINISLDKPLLFAPPTAEKTVRSLQMSETRYFPCVRHETANLHFHQRAVWGLCK